jgi:hypothetical protein
VGYSELSIFSFFLNLSDLKFYSYEFSFPPSFFYTVLLRPTLTSNMSLPTSYKQWKTAQTSLSDLTIIEAPMPSPGPNEVLVKIHSVALTQFRSCAVHQEVEEKPMTKTERMTFGLVYQTIGFYVPLLDRHAIRDFWGEHKPRFPQDIGH